jgi:SET family sugar efflux transporter-like MFS transporter
VTRPEEATPTAVGSTGRGLFPIALVFLVVGLSTAMAAPFLALFLTDAVRADGAHVGAFLVAAPIASVVVTTLVGRLSDRLRSRQGLLVAAALAGCAGTAVTAVVRNYWLLLLVTVTLTAVAGSLMSQVFAYARESLGDSGRVALTISWLRSLFSVAWVAGPPIAAALLQVGGFTLVYGGASAMYGCAALVALVSLGEPRPAGPHALVEGQEGGRRQGSAPADASRMVLWATVLVFVLTRCAGQLAVQGLPLFTTRVIGTGVGDAGLLLGLCAALEIPFMIGFGALSTRVALRRLLIGGAVCGLGYMTLAAAATSTWQLVVGQVLNAASIAATSGLGITYVQDLMPGRAGWASTLFSNTFAGGAVLAGPVLGAAQEFGYRMPYVVGAVLSVVALALLMATRTAPSPSRTTP